MKPYGIKRSLDLVYPDCADIVHYGLKSSASHVRGKGGDFHNSLNSGAKARVRRTHKRKARAEAKNQCLERED